MKTNLTTGLSALCAILLIVLLVLQTKQKGELETLGTNLESRLLQDEQQAKEQMSNTMNAVQQNTAVLHRAIGKKLAVELPLSLTNQLAALEVRIADEKFWPKDSTNMDAMFAELRGLIRQIPPWAEEDYLPRLNALRWEVQSLEVIQANATTKGEALDVAAEAYANQLAIQPDGGAANIAAVLAIRQKDAITRFGAFRRDSAISAAKEQIGLAEMTDGLGVWQHLVEWTNDPTVLGLRQQLHSRLIDDGIASFIKSSQDNLHKLIVVTNFGLRQAGYARLLDSVNEQRLNVLQQPDTSQNSRSRLEDFYKTLETQVKEEGDKQNLGYQRWALRQIQRFNEAYEAIKAKRVTERKELADKSHGKSIFSTEAAVGVVGAVPVLWVGYYAATEAIAYEKIPLNYKAVAGAMETFLLPISSGYLDPAVSRLYNNAFDSGWKELENAKPLQSGVAEQESVIVKKTLQNYQEEQ
jgi:hypothetical protein